MHDGIEAVGVTLLQLSTHVDPRGALTVIEEGRQTPFAIRRVYFIRDVPPAGARAGHAHRKSQTVLVAVAGSFDVHVDNGFQGASHRLESPSDALVIPERIWLEVDDFEPGAICLALSSHLFDEDDYWSDHEEFRRAVGAAP